MTLTGSRRMVAVAAATLTVALAGCGATTASTPSSTPPSAGVSVAGSVSASASRQAWVRGTKVTVTNGTGSAQQISQTGGTDYSALAAGASFSLLDEWNTAGGTSVQFHWKVSDRLAFKIEFLNPSFLTPTLQTCNLYPVDGTDCNEVYLARNDLYFSENETQSINLKNEDKQVVATLTVTRGADDDDNKNWTATLDTNTAS